MQNTSYFLDASSSSKYVSHCFGPVVLFLICDFEYHAKHFINKIFKMINTVIIAVKCG